MKQISFNIPFTARTYLMWTVNTKKFSILSRKVPQNPTTVPHTRFQESVYVYLTNTEYCKKLAHHLRLSPSYNDTDIVNQLKDYSSKSKFMRKGIWNNHNLLASLPSYIFHMKQRNVSKEEIYSVDDVVADIFDVTRSQTTISQQAALSEKILHAWLTILHPNFFQITQLMCFGKLIKHRCRELLRNPSNELQQSPLPLVYLTFVAGIGKANTLDSQEVLNQLAQFSQDSPKLTYENCNPFELAIICESFFKGGMKLDSQRFLSHVSTELCSLLSPQESHLRDDFNPFVIVSLLKIIRQVNYIERKVLELLREFILNPVNEKKVRNIGFLTNVLSAFVGPERRFILTQPTAEKSRLSLLNQVEYLVVSIVEENESIKSDKKAKNDAYKDSSIANKTAADRELYKEPVGFFEPSSMSRVRLKDVSRWLWAASSLRYQISSPKTYEKDLGRRVSTGEFFKRTEDAVDALLALSIMNHYLDDSIVTKILRSPDFRSSIRKKCSIRHRWRFGLYLTSLKVERGDQWRQLDPELQKELLQIAGPPLGKTEAWSASNFPEKVRRDKKALMSMPEMKDHVTHSELLNQCMAALRRIFNVSESECNNNSINGNRSRKNTFGTLKPQPDYQAMEASNENSEAAVLHGYAIQFLHIPGIKLMPPNSQKEIYIEVLHEDAISPGLHEFKIRLLRKMGHSVYTVSHEEIRSCMNLEQHFKTLLPRIDNH